MRTGAIFARGSCRALKWVALVGMVFALGAVGADAQLSDPRLTITATDSIEGGSTTVTVTMSAEVQPDPDTTDDTDHTYVLGLTVTPTANDGGDNTPADAGDWTIADEVSNTDGDAALLELTFENTDPTDSERRVDTATFTLHHLTPDEDAEHEDLRLTVTLTTGSEQGLSVVDPDTGDDRLDITIRDNERQYYVLKKTSPDEPMEGDPITVTLEAMPKHVQGAQMLTLRLAQDGLGYEIGTIMGGQGTPGSNTVTLGAEVATDGSITTRATDATNKATIPLSTTVTNDKNREEDTLTVSAFRGVGLPAETGDPDVTNDGPLEITLADKHELPMITAALVDSDGNAVTGGPPIKLTEGEDYMLTLSAPAAVTEEITVTLTASGTATTNDDYSLGSSTITIPDGDTSSAPVSLNIDLNDDLVDDTLIFTAVVAGEDENGTSTMEIATPPLLDLVLDDATSTWIWVKTGAEDAIATAMTNGQRGDGQINVGDDFRIPKSALFEAAEGYSVEVSARSSDVGKVIADPQPGSDEDNVLIDVRATTTEGVPVTITLTGTAVNGPSSARRQVSVDVAEITFDVTVELAVPGTPRNLEAAPGNGQVTLTWQAPNDGGEVASYEYDMNADRDWQDAGRGTTKTVTGLDNGTLYVFRVRAVNSSGAGDPTETVSATPTSTAGVEAPVEVKSVSVDKTSVAESGGLEVTVTATVPAGEKVDGKVAPIDEKRLYVWFPTDDESIADGEEAEAADLTVLGDLLWEDIPRTEKESEAKFKFRVAIGQDLDAEDEKFQVEVEIDGGEGKKSKVVTIDDAQEQTYVLSLPSANKGAITEGKSATLTLEAKPERTIDIPVTLALEPNDPSRYTLSSANGTFGTTSFETTVSTKADSDRADDTLTVTAYTERHGKFTSLDITVKDANALPAVKATLVDDKGKALDPQPESVMEGESVHVMLTAVDKDGKNMKAAEKLTITLMPTGTADAQDYRLSSQSFEIAKDKESSAAVELMVTEDQDIGEETLMFDAAVAGEAKNGTEKRSVAGVLSLMVMDGTQKLVYAKPQEEVEAAIYAAKTAGAGDDMTFTTGEMIEVMGSALFSSGEGVSLSYTAESDHDHVATASVSGGMVTVTAGDEAGMAHITITAHASMPSGVKILDQTDPRMASIVFPVEVGLEALSIELMGPEDMNLAEGMSAMVTATASREVTEDVTVMLMRDRAMSSASDEDYMAEAIVIEAGMMTGSTMVMAVEDNMAEDMEELVLYGMTEGMAGEVTGNVKLYLWDAAVPALPVIGQLLLAAFLAVGGYRRYRRR